MSSQKTSSITAGETASFLKAVLRGDLGAIYRASNTPAVTSSYVFRLVQALTEKQHGDKYKSRVVNCVPPHFLWIMARPAPTAASYIHRAFCRALWRERDGKDRVKLLAWCAAWPLILIVTCIWATAINGSAIARRSGKSIPRQMAEQLKVAWRFGCLPQWYYIFELFDRERLSRAADYLHRFETKGGIYRMMEPLEVEAVILNLRDKMVFATKCRDNHLPVAEEHFVYRAGDAIAGLALPPTDLFIKPLIGTGGTGVEAWLYQLDGRYQSLFDGETLNETGLLERMQKNNQDVVVQTRLVNHGGIRDLSNGALVTVRMMTFLNETGGHEATHAGLRMAIGANRLVDNFHAGGIIAAIDMAAGRLGPATDIGLRPDIGWCTHHPDTGALIAGRLLPFWPETVELACRAHAAFAPRVVIGWDIAITPKGPVLIEGNSSPDVDLIQRSYRAPLGTSRMAELIRFHLRNKPATMALIGDDP